jgi:CO dehydrogenase maturation factor
VGNKVTDPAHDPVSNVADVDYLHAEIGNALIGWFTQSAWVRHAERGAAPPIDTLEPANLATLDVILAALDAQSRDWAAYHRNTVAFHLRNAHAWANTAAGTDLTLQVDPEFVPGPVAAPHRLSRHGTACGNQSARAGPAVDRVPLSHVACYPPANDNDFHYR